MDETMRLSRCLSAVCFVGVIVCGQVRVAVAGDAPPLPGNRGRAEHVVLVVCDGLRPDYVAEETMPTLAALARSGVFFERHHPVYPTSTEVNGAALATGCFPDRTGILANREYRPAINPLKAVPTESPATIRQGDALTGGKYLGVPTLPELVRAAGGRTAVAGTKGVALFWDRAERPADHRDVTVFGGQTVPAEAVQQLNEALGGPFPAELKFPNVAQDLWTTRALTEALWKDGVPTLSVLWLSDPDYSQHNSGPGSPTVRAALRENVDANLRRVLDALDAKGVRAKTDVLVVSDHGFSTVYRTVDAVEELKKAGFRIVPQLFQAPLKPGEIFYVGLGGTMTFYVGDHDVETTRRLVEYLQGGDFAGVIFTRGEEPSSAALAGTFPLAKVHLESPDAPDVVVSLRWDDERNRDEVPGRIISDPGRSVGQGTHATLSRFDLHNTLIAAGPDFRVGFRNGLPSGNVDVAPTVAALLGLKGAKMDGRMLAEAFTGTKTPPSHDGLILREDAKAEAGKWRQQLQTVTVGGVTYLEQGNAGPAPKQE